MQGAPAAASRPVTGPERAAGSFRPPAWLRGGHAQTIWPVVLARPAIAFRRERVDTPDGDFWDLDWLDPPDATNAPRLTGPVPTVILFHGLEGSSDSHYARALMALLRSRGWRGVIPHFRGCGGEPNRLPRAYHSGDHEEIGAMLAAVHARVDDRRGAAPLYAVGVSLGGSALLNWLGRAGAAAATMLAAAAAVSTPLDLTAAGHAIGRGFNRLYTWHFLGTLVPKSIALAQRHPGLLDPARVRRVRNLYDFDELVTAPLHGFAGTDDYWRRASSKPWLARIRVPTLVLNARNDPFVPAASLPGPDDIAPDVRLEQPQGGGHVGFLTGPFPGNVRWLPERLLQFFVAGR
jgi:predicted alpha/beta-fold hydrolase